MPGHSLLVSKCRVLIMSGQCIAVVACDLHEDSKSTSPENIIKGMGTGNSPWLLFVINVVTYLN